MKNYEQLLFLFTESIAQMELSTVSVNTVVMQLREEHDLGNKYEDGYLRRITQVALMIQIK